MPTDEQAVQLDSGEWWLTFSCDKCGRKKAIRAEPVPGGGGWKYERLPRGWRYGR